MLCHRCGTELAGAAICGNCGTPAGRRRFRPTLTAVRAPDPEALRAAAAGLEKGEVVGEQFALGDPIGPVAGGWLFEAREPGGSALAVRFVGPIDDGDARGAALEVLERARRLSHDNIARTYAVGAHRDWLFIAGERLDGLTLAKIMELRREKQQRFTLAELLPIFEPLRDALLHAHRHLPHGGLDPSVVHILPAALKVADFGLATALPEHFARWRTEAGRARTLAPEVLAGEAPTARSDIYSLGALVYEMTSGVPFSTDAPPPSVASGVMGGHPIDDIVARATAADPSARFEDVVEFAEALSVVADGAPLEVDDGERTRKVAAPRPVDEGSTAPTGRFVRAPAPGSSPDSSPGSSPDSSPDSAPDAAAEGSPAPGGESLERAHGPDPDDDIDTVPLAAAEGAAAESSGPPPVPTAALGPAAAATPPPGEASSPPPLPPAPADRPSMQPQTPPGAMGPAGRGALVRPGSGGPSVVIDPAFARLDTVPPPADFRPSSDRTPTQPVVVPPRRRPWIERSNLGFGLLLALIVGGVALAVVWAIQRDGNTGPEGPTVEASSRPDPVKPRQPPPVVVAAIEADAAPPAAPDAGPSAIAAARSPSAVEPPARKPSRSAEPAPVAESEPREPDPQGPGRQAPEPREPAQQEPDQPEPEPVAEPRAPAEPESVAEPEPTPEPETAREPPVEAPPSPVEPPEPEELRCPGGMILVTHRGFPSDGKRRGVVVGAGIEAARAGQAYCIDAHEYPGRGQIPRTGVNFEAARGLCLARGRRLCTDAEWRRGCAGRRGAAWPYGKAFDPAKCNTEDADGEERALAPSGQFRRCKSIRGVYDMSGNAAEWTADQTVRGGDFAATDEDASCGGGGKRAPGSSRPSIGFRCCADFTE